MLRYANLSAFVKLTLAWLFAILNIINNFFNHYFSPKPSNSYQERSQEEHILFSNKRSHHPRKTATTKTEF